MTDLSKLPSPIRQQLADAIEARQARLAREAVAANVDSYAALVLEITTDLGPCLLPFVELIRARPSWWTDAKKPGEHRIATIALPGLDVIAIRYERAVNPPGWVRAPGWFVGATRHDSWEDALLAAYDAGDDSTEEGA